MFLVYIKYFNIFIHLERQVNRVLEVTHLVEVNELKIAASASLFCLHDFFCLFLSV